MTKSSGTADEILKLPSGGGSVSGPGTSFSVDLNTGTLTAGLKLELPCGPNGIVPQIALNYSSAAGDGPFGRGWSLGTLTVLRKVTPSLMADPDEGDSYSLSGVGELLPMGGGRYRPAVDTTGQLIEFNGGGWSVTDNKDTTFTLGTTPASQIGSAPAAWLLDGCSDSSGNKITYSWRHDLGAPLLDEVAWGTYQLVFKYEARPDRLLDGVYGAPLWTTQRCSAIELHVTTEAVSFSRSWQLTYEDEAGLGRSFLASIVEQGHAADGSVLAAPARSFAYTNNGAAALMPVSGWTSPLNDPDTDLVDLNGDGLPDILRLGAGLPTVSLNLGGGKFGFPTPLSRAPSTLRLSAPSVAFADMSGGGNADLLVLDQPFAGYFPLANPGGTAPAGFDFPVVFPQAPSVLPGGANVRLLDLNGDNITDVLVDTGRAWLVYLRSGTSGWADYPVVLPPEVTPPVSLTDPHVYLADMTGDGYTDIVLVNGGGVTYWPARADGGWDQAVAMSGAPAPDRNWQPSRLALFDVDGDGCADLVYVGATGVTVWLNSGADRLAAPFTIDHTPLATPGSYRLVDLLGSGTVGVQFELPQLAYGQSRQSFLDLTGGVKPGLLSEIVNGPGRSTHVTYRTSTGFAQDDLLAAQPWPTYHPFPVQCVAQTDQTDVGTGVTLTTQYAYHDGRYDPAQRIFLGFGRVDTEELGDASCPTLRTETVFHLGLDPEDPSRPLTPDEALQFGALRRKVLQATVWGLDGSPDETNPYSIVVNIYAAKLLPSAATDSSQVAVPYTVSTNEERWERQATVLSNRQIQYLEVDDEGDVTLQRTTATRAGQATPDQDVITRTSFATGGRNIRLPARVTQTLADGTVIGATVNFYDGEPFVGLPEGQATLGLESRVEQLAFADDFGRRVWGVSPPDLTAYGYHRMPGDSTGWWLTQRAQQRDATGTGPRLSTQGPLGALQRLQLDSSGQHVVSVSDAVGNTLTATFSSRVWQIESVTDQNGNTSRDVFDSLGRVVATIRAGDTAALPWASYAYDVAAVSTVTANARIAHGQAQTLPALTFIDGSGAMLGKAESSLTPGDWVVSQGAARNGRGLTLAAYLPYQISGADWQAPPPGTGAVRYVYDALGRVIQRTRADGLVVSVGREGDTLVTSEQWPAGPATDIEKQTYDAAGQLIAVSRWDGTHWVEQTYQYAPSGRVGSITLPGGATVSFDYDLLGRRFGHESADTGKTVYLLDACGNERLRTLSTGQQVRTEVDVMNRVTRVFHDAEASPRIAYSYYDQGGAAPDDGITANRAGRVWRVVDELGEVNLEYEETGRVTKSTRVVAGGGASYIEQYTYDALGRTTSVVLPSTTGIGVGRTVDYTYASDGRLSAASGVVNAASYDLIGRPTALSFGNGAQTLIDYRPNGGSIERVRVLDASSTAIRDVTVAIDQSLITGLTSATPDDDSASFAYDGFKRLTTADYSQSATTLDQHGWAYDDAFNVITASDAGALSYAPGTHRLAGVGGSAVVFDAAGRMATGRFGPMLFDASDHLSQVTMPGSRVIAHAYGYNGLRVRTTVDGVLSYLAPTDNFTIQGSHNVAWICFGALRLAAEVDGELWFLHTNATGNMDLITDATGKAAARARLTPYGLSRPGGASSNDAAAALVVLLSGLDVSGLICQGQRWYDPALGQFISPDPFINGIFTIGIWNPYLYCLGNPLSLSDPTGCDFWSVLEIIGIALLAAVCVVGAIWTGGASLVALGVLTANLSTGMLVGVAIGALGGAIAGELAAQKAGGSIWAGAFIGALLGGVSSLAGGALGGLVGGALKSLPLLQYVTSGAVQGVIAGLGTGVAIGYAGGKGSAEQILIAAALGAAWGASLGALLGLGGYFLVGNVPAGQQAYLQFGNIINKYDADPAVQGGISDSLNAVDNQLGLGNDIAQLATKPSAGNVFGLLPDFVGVQNASGNVGLFFSNGSIVNIPLGWVPNVVLNSGGFSAVVQVSFAADQAGFSYADQISLLLKAAPYFIDYALTLFEEGNPNNDYNKSANAFNKAFGSANQDEYAT